MKKVILIVTVWFLLSNYTMAQWQQTNGPFGGTVNCLTSKGDTVYVGTDGGAFYTIDNGNNWTKINNGLTDSNVISLIINGNNLFAGVNDTFGIYISHNNGNNWSNNNLKNQWYLKPVVSSIAISGTNIYAGTKYGLGVFLSTDNGMNWTRLNNLSSLTYYNINTLLIKGKNIFAGTDHGIYLSQNNGNSWALISNGINTNITSLALKDSFLFVGTKGSGIFMTSDLGKNWTTRNNGMITNINTLTISGTDIFAGTDTCVYISGDNGNSWKSSRNGFGFYWKKRSV